MDPQVVLELMRESFKVGLLLAMPIMMSALLVGVLVSVIQAVTSIQEQTMVFVPKIIAVSLATLLAFSWMMGKIITFTTDLIGGIPEMLQ